DGKERKASPMHPTPPGTSPRGRAVFLRVRWTQLAAPVPAEKGRRAVPWLGAIVAVGLGLRSYHYLGNPPVWHDEAAQIYNVMNLDWAHLLGPLYYSEACPPLFLSTEKALAALLGDGTFALRLLPFLASCAALIALIAPARLVLPWWGQLWFAAALACSDRLLWHCCEAKPYAVDMLIA